MDPLGPPPGALDSPLRKHGLTCLLGCTGVIALIPVVLVLAIVVFYVEEDWRGAHAWAKAQADLASEGETVDPAKFIPAPIPDADNFGALLYFKVISVPGGIGDVQMKRFAISQTLKPITDNIAYSPDDTASDHKLPFLGNWQKGQPPDSQNLAGKMAAFLKLNQPDATIEPNASPIQIFEQACPVMAELRAAEPTHPQCQFPEPITYDEPWNQSFGTDTSLLSLDKVLLYDAQLAILSNQPDLALDDFRVGWKGTAGEQKRPYYVSNLVAAGIVAMQLRVIQEGLATHVWNDQQLTALDSDLGKIDFLAQSRHEINGEIACYSMPMIDYYATHRGRWDKDVNALGLMLGEDDHWRERAFAATYLLVPRGWFDLAKADLARRKIEVLRRIDLISYRVHPGPDPEKSQDPALRWLNFILPVFSLTKDMENHIAYTQVQLDEARIACRIERYHLAHQSYPATLDQLSSAYGPLPNDLITGQPYHYRLIAPDKYLIYSVGWNQVDDHGDAGNGRTWESPDWIWTNYPNQN